MSPLRSDLVKFVAELLLRAVETNFDEHGLSLVSVFLVIEVEVKESLLRCQLHVGFSGLQELCPFIFTFLASDLYTRFLKGLFQSSSEHG